MVKSFFSSSGVWVVAVNMGMENAEMTTRTVLYFVAMF